MKLRAKTSCWQQDIRAAEYVRGTLISTLLTVLTAWLYYRSVLAVPLLAPVWLWHYSLWKRECLQKKISSFQLQFKDAIQALSSSLCTGYSVENAWKETEKELKLLYSDDDRIRKELHIIVSQIRINVPMEQIMGDFTERVRQEDVQNFAAVFTAARKSGGDMVAIIQNTAGQIGDKIEVKREIDTILAAKEYEFKVMSAVPYIIIGYMSLSSPEFMGALYGNVIGTGVMTVCLAAYIGACCLGQRIIGIEV